MKIDPQITWEPCRKKYNFYFYVTNVFFDAGERGECMETFLGLWRLEKPPKISLHFSESITIGISIQNGHLLPRVILASCWPSHRAARKMTSRKSYWVSEGVLHTRAGRAHAPTSPGSPLPWRKPARHYPLRRRVMFCSGYVPIHKHVMPPWAKSYEMGHETADAIPGQSFIYLKICLFF
jgi:hypothetical protein